MSPTLTTEDIAAVCDADRHTDTTGPDRSTITVAQLEEAYRISHTANAA
ncbi:hypothetical protein Xcel_3433 (plasmid) [Xylanimonas cellulosilytica DSM 15894]|uniref:Uncharacterized protein n=1 Tax=Xylanimonas cellulosilytica (strain DSM 15894 / JCM 12276 / CECT 5975 / KCTC 9989 / LMG 20990 / NBRC 107835 / XIL07) TaxID=446471 RepID=D1C0W6_XYLCX|nr:hypothetical protein [Xylanimonas cellulosilytica]ACZ32432.1 hypothetical protein Xcel_3433 [Xylanimonas cellulosilytica DSM 15894]